MNQLACLILLAFVAETPAADKPDLKADLQAIQGKWKVVTVTFDGKAAPIPADSPRHLVFEEKEFIAVEGDKKGRTLAFTLDPTTTPKRFDVVRPGPDDKAAGIYQLAGDKLTICYAEPGAARPEKLESKAGAKVFLLELERIKK